MKMTPNEIFDWIALTIFAIIIVSGSVYTYSGDYLRSINIFANGSFFALFCLHSKLCSIEKSLRDRGI